MIWNELEKLEKEKFVEVCRAVDLAKFTTIKLSIIGDVVKVFSEYALSEVLKVLYKEELAYHVIGWGANQVISKTEDVVFLTLKFSLDRKIFSQVRKEYHLPASTPLNVLQSHAQKFGLKGWEALTGIPASLGGAIYMNAGTSLGEIKSIVKAVTLINELGEKRTINVSDKSFSYRRNHFVLPGEIITSAVLIHHGQSDEIKSQITQYMQFRKATQPLKSRNCGCVWKNADEFHKAGLFIDKLCLGGINVGDLFVSEMHSNFYENKGNARFEDFTQLTEVIFEQLKLHTGIEFELEAKVY